MPTRSLPLRPNLAQLKLQANELHQQHRQGSPAAAARIAAHHPRFKGVAETAVLDQDFVLADAQLVVAREYGFDSWPRLKHAVEISEPWPHSSRTRISRRPSPPWTTATSPNCAAS